MNIVRTRVIVSLLALALCPAGMLLAAAPVTFDVATTLTARVATTAEFAREHPGDKLIVIRARVSLFAVPGAARELSDWVVTLESPSAEFEVVDFLPKTALDSRFTGNVDLTLKQDQTTALDFDANGAYKALTGGHLTGSYHDENHLHAQLHMLPPRELVLAAGTVRRGKGVYFKLNGSSQSTLEGEKEFLVMARVPQAWRGDVGRVRCEARGRANSPFANWDEPTMLARQDFLVAFSLLGDELARARASACLAAAEKLQRLAMQEERAIERNSTPKLLRKVGITSPTISSDWLRDWLFGPVQPAFAERLPANVGTAAMEFAQQRSQLHRLNGAAAERADNAAPGLN